MSGDLSQQLLQAVAGVVVIIITGYVVPWIKAKIEEMKLNFIYTWIEKAVYAVEKIAEREDIDKFEYVSNFIEQKFNLSDAEAKILIESAVKILNMEDVWGEVIPNGQPAITIDDEV